MYIRKIIKIRLIVSFSILIFLIIISNYLNFNIINNVSNIIEYKNINSSNEGISFDELSKVKDNYSNIEFTGCKEIKANVTNKYGVPPEKEIKTKIVLTDQNYFDLYPFKVVRGGKLDSLSVKNGGRVAIISDVLADSLFKSVDVIGSTLNIGSSKYKIEGVYKENKSLLYSAAEDGYERIYIPYTDYQDINKKDKLCLDTMATKETKQYDEKAINDKLSKVLNDKLTLYKSVNYAVSKNIVLQTVKILYFMIGIIIISFLIKRVVKLICKANLLLKENLKSNYLKEALLNNKKQFLIFVAKIVICILVMVMVFNIVKFNLVIQDRYLPSNNIFDVDFYRKAIISNMQLNNANENGVQNVYDRYIVIVNNIGKAVFWVEIFAMAEVLINQKILNKLQFVEQSTDDRVQSTVNDDLPFASLR